MTPEPVVNPLLNDGGVAGWPGDGDEQRPKGGTDQSSGCGDETAENKCEIVTRGHAVLEAQYQ